MNYEEALRYIEQLNTKGIALGLERITELLERLGNKKSAVIIAALNEYMISHPELQSPYCKIEVKVGSALNQDRVEQIVRSIVEEKLSMLQLSGTATPKAENISDTIEKDVVTMLDNLDLFG